jgi:bifunctional DNA-binding transcriptional regulator/antitoxin component of YhaV-PrlF toxin-antitoxin module
MQQLATITSKRQLTIPAGIFKNLGLETSRKVLIRADKNVLTIEPATFLVHSLAGSIRMPTKYKGKSADAIIQDAKRRYFRKKKS